MSFSKAFLLLAVLGCLYLLSQEADARGVARITSEDAASIHDAGAVSSSDLGGDTAGVGVQKQGSLGAGQDPSERSTTGHRLFHHSGQKTDPGLGN